MIEKESKDWHDKMNFKNMELLYKDSWSNIFNLKNFGDLNKPLTP